VLGIVVHREHHYARVGRLAPDLAQGPESVAVRHAEVEQAHVGLAGDDGLDRRAPRGRLTHDLDALGVRQGEAQAAQDESMVVGDHNADARPSLLCTGFGRHSPRLLSAPGAA
jgi:hypothetical protein